MTKDAPVERHHRITNHNAIDLHVGKRVRLRRTLLGLSQEQLGAELNITFQQVQKYERGPIESALPVFRTSARF